MSLIPQAPRKHKSQNPQRSYHSPTKLIGTQSVFLEDYEIPQTAQRRLCFE